MIYTLDLLRNNFLKSNNSLVITGLRLLSISLHKSHDFSGLRLLDQQGKFPVVRSRATILPLHQAIYGKDGGYQQVLDYL
jgi:hypothetical protein